MSDMVSSGTGFPVELPRPPPGSSSRPVLGFATGIAVGVILSAIAVQAWLAVHLAPVAGTWAGFGAESIANLSRLAVSPAWRWGVPAATAVVVAGLLALGVRRARWYALLSGLAIVAVAPTYVWAMAPWTAVADKIR